MVEITVRAGRNRCTRRQKGQVPTHHTTLFYFTTASAGEQLTCHGVELAEAVDDITLIGVRERCLCYLIVANPMVDLVGDENDAPLLAHLPLPTHEIKRA